MSEAGTPIGEWSYRWSEVPRPFVHPVTTPAGRVLSVDAPEDHWWHHALWFTIKFINGENFWEEYEEYGLLAQKRAPVLMTGPDGSVSATSRIEWMRPGRQGPGTGSRVLAQDLQLRYSTSENESRLDWDTTLVPDVDIVADRTPFTTWGGYGGLTFRGRPDWHDTVLRIDDGQARERVLGERSKWCSLEGPLPPSEERAGLVMFDHPDNPRYPTCWYASTRADTYGTEGWSNFANAAFIWEGPMEVRAGSTLRLKHRVLTHEGARSHAELEEDWERWLSEAQQ